MPTIGPPTIVSMAFKLLTILSELFYGMALPFITALLISLM